jgi:hypothetical protein
MHREPHSVLPIRAERARETGIDVQDQAYHGRTTTGSARAAATTSTARSHEREQRDRCAVSRAFARFRPSACPSGCARTVRGTTDAPLRRDTLRHASMKVAIYARYSSDNQRDASIADQMRVCRAFAERQGWTIYLFSGLTKCGVCGAGFIMSSKNRLGCFGARDQGRCDNHLTTRRDEVEARGASWPYRRHRPDAEPGRTANRAERESGGDAGCRPKCEEVARNGRPLAASCDGCGGGI